MASTQMADQDSWDDKFLLPISAASQKVYLGSPGVPVYQPYTGSVRHRAPPHRIYNLSSDCN